MARTTPAQISDDNVVVITLLRLKYWDGAAPQEVRLSNAPVDLSINVGGGAETWSGSGLLLTVDSATESNDINASNIGISLDGVDQSIITIIMSNHFRNQKAEVYKAWYSKSTGTIHGSPVNIFTGYQLEPYTISETSTDNPDAVKVSTTLTNRLAIATSNNEVITNMASHYNYVQRAGLPDTAAEFWFYTPGLEGQDAYWGKAGPNPWREQFWTWARSASERILERVFFGTWGAG